MDERMAATTSEEESAVVRHIVPRPRLTNLLSSPDARVTLIVAPAGYGKTTLIREWFALKGLPNGWFTASDAAIDIAALVVGLSRAASSVLPTTDSKIRQSLEATRESAPDAGVLFDLLAADLEDWPEQAWLVIDDYQALTLSPLAEAYVGRLADLPQMRLIIASRQRPAWATARRLLYGEIRELGRATLAMTSDEAMAVLADRPAREAEGLAALADGWPAVIGLAALSGSEITQLPDEVPETLHDFFAQELFNAIPVTLRDLLVRLAIPQIVSPDVARLIGDAEADGLVELAVRHGFLTPAQGGHYEMHPLLRRFLLEKLDANDEGTRIAIRQLGAHLIEMGSWDDAFELIERFDLTPLMVPLVEEAVDDLLRSGRLTTLRRWVEYAVGHDVLSPARDFAEAEIAFREGRYPEAEALATRAATSFESGHPLVARAWSRAAQSAHLDDRVAEGLVLHERAAACATDDTARQHAIWGQFISQSELDLTGDARETLERFRHESRTPEDLLRESQARVSMGIRWDGLTPKLLAASEHDHLGAIEADPVVKSAYLQMLGCALSLNAQYERALAVSNESLAIAEKFRLDFLYPHALYVHATALIGLRQLVDATKAIRKQASFARSFDDGHSILNALILEARIALTKRRPDEALRLLDVTPPAWPTPGLAGELHAIRALAYASLGDRPGLKQSIQKALGFSMQLETQIPSLWAKTIGAPALTQERVMEEAFGRSQTAGHLDTIVLAYRTEPKILPILATFPHVRANLRRVLEAAHDHALARRVGVTIAQATTRRSLTQRESEVLDLLRQGLTNAEISRALWISEATTKVHVRRVLEKLGVRSRVQAATAVLSDQED
jgi:DNA-binding CsgD family transcriptional regulator/tetratricopeptide (TPR) repeat protein